MASPVRLRRTAASLVQLARSSLDGPRCEPVTLRLSVLAWTYVARVLQV